MKTSTMLSGVSVERIPKSLTFSQIVKCLEDSNPKILEYLSKKQNIQEEKLDEVEQKLADVDGNGKVTNADAMHILRYTIHSKVAYNIGDGIYRDYKDTPDIPLDILLPYTKSVY